MVCPLAGEMLLAEFHKVLYWGLGYFLFVSTILILICFQRYVNLRMTQEIGHAVATEDEMQLLMK